LKFSILNFIQRQLPEFKHARAKLPMLHAKETFIVPKAFGKPQGLKPNSFFSHLVRLKPCPDTCFERGCNWDKPANT